MKDEKYTIMLVDDNMASLTMGKNILKDKYEVYPIDSGEKLFEILQKVIPDLILLDVSMPEMDGYEVIKRLKASARTQEIPVIFVTSRDDPGNELEGLSLGAVDYISKPFSPALLIQRINNHLILSGKKKELTNYNEHLKEMVKVKSVGVEGLPYAVLGAMAELAEFRDDRTGHGQINGKSHMDRTQACFKAMTDAIIEEKVYEKAAALWDLDLLVPSALLHDLGKLMISEQILKKPGKLSLEEFGEIKKHTDGGVRIIDRISRTSGDHTFLKYARIIAGTHHERWDGTGYPSGLSGEAIPLEGRIMALVDVYDALVSPRPYKEPISPVEAERIIIEGSETQFDPRLVEVFRKAAPRFAQITG